MMRLRIAVLALALACTLAGGAAADPGWRIEFEAGPAFTTRNDVRIPGDGGTDLSLVDDLSSETAFAWRVNAARRFGTRHEVLFLAAPLRVDAEGSVAYPVVFSGTTFPAGSHLASRYRFDSYRLTYRYNLHRSERLQAWVGLTAKLRDAAIRLQDDTAVAEKKNTGLVPLVNFRIAWQLGSTWSFLVDGDALAAPQGRAEDVLLAFCARVDERVTLRAGYRILEGGADNAEVYNFALVQYAVLGASVSF